MSYLTLTCSMCTTVCRGAKADLVFLIDGSWSIGDESFSKVIQFVFSMIGAFDVIHPGGMQVRSHSGYPLSVSSLMFTAYSLLFSSFSVYSSCQCFLILALAPSPPSFVFWKQVSFVQFSDSAKTEFKLNTYQDKGRTLAALQLVRYMGGNTKTGTPTDHSDWLPVSM